LTTIGRFLRRLLIACVLFISYSLTRPPYLSLTYGTDGGELTTAAATFGIAHPPGYGLFTLVTGLAMRIIPGDSTVQKMQIIAHLTAIALSLLVGMIASALIAEPRRREQVFTLAALLCGWSRPVWEQALMIEVYLFLALLIAGILYLVTLQNKGRWTYLMIGHVIGLAVTHHLTALLWLPGLAILLLQKGLSRRLLWSLIGLITGLWPWLYLMLRAGHVAQANWGGIEQGREALIAHITAQEYRVFLQPVSLEAVLHGIVQWVSTLPAQITPFGVILLLIGIAVLLHERKWGGLLASVLWIVGVAGFTGLYRAPQTQAAYTLGLIILIVMITTRGVMRLIGEGSGWIMWGVPLLLVVAHAQNLDQRDDMSGLDFLARVNRLAPPHAVVLVERDGETFLLWAAQTLEGWRPDLAIINGTLLYKDWYAASLARLTPDLSLVGATQAERLQSLYTTSRPIIAPRLIKPPPGMQAVPLGEGWYCLVKARALC